MPRFTTSRKQRMKGSPTKTFLLRGHFVNGVWYCNCNPRLPASNFEVKKEGPNTGRWFYTCQQPKDSSCGFFLWKEDAVAREITVLMANSRSGAGSAGAFHTPGRRTEEDDSFGDWSLSPEEEMELTQSLARPGSGSPSPETPRKASKITHFSTPGSQRKVEETILPTSSNGGRPSMKLFSGRRDEDVYPTSSTNSQGTWDGYQPFGLRSPSETPTSSRYGESTVARASQVTQNNYDITDEVLDLLKDQLIDEDTTAKLKQLLSRHALKISGIAKGRDITRAALKDKETTISELQQRISTLEAQREMDKTVIRHLKSDMAESVERTLGRGRGRGS